MITVNYKNQLNVSSNGYYQNQQFSTLSGVSDWRTFQHIQELPTVYVSIKFPAQNLSKTIILPPNVPRHSMPYNQGAKIGTRVPPHQLCSVQCGSNPMSHLAPLVPPWSGTFGIHASKSYPSNERGETSNESTSKLVLNDPCNIQFISIIHDSHL